MASQYFKRELHGKSDKVFRRTCCDRKRGLKLSEGRFILDTRKEFFTVKVVEL